MTSSKEASGRPNVEPVTYNVKATGDIIQPFPKSMKNGPNSALGNRDHQAIEYSKGELNEGDILVFINYPNNAKVVDACGFELRNRHRVHSRNLLRTGSSYFKYWLDPIPQARLKRRLGYSGGKELPNGVLFVLDLTPPYEGDQALELLSDLSCSRGVRAWFTSGGRLKVDMALVGGRDEVAYMSSSDTSKRDISPTKSSTVLTSDTTDVIVSGDGTTVDGSSMESRVEADHQGATDSTGDTTTEEEFVTGAVVHEYDPIRHRACIERLLQAIEGKNPRLDSAPKVWTVVMLAKYFDCTSVVEGYVIAWLYNEPNCKFIEVLPEAALCIGYALKAPCITRQAFAILVSEEAVRVGNPLFFGSLVDNAEQKDITRFGRVRENIINEDIVNTIQHAGQAFAAGIEAIFKKLLDPQLQWLQELSEHQKLDRLASHEFADSTSSQEAALVITEFKNALIAYVRGRLFTVLLQQLSTSQMEIADAHRSAQNWNSTPSEPFTVIYDGLNDFERFMCRFTRDNIRFKEWDTGCYSNQIRDSWGSFHPWHEKQYELADTLGIPYSNIALLVDLENKFNRLVARKTISANTSPTGGPLAPLIFPPASSGASENSQPGDGSSEGGLVFSTSQLLASLRESAGLNAIPSQQDNRTQEYSPFINLSRLLYQVSLEIKHITEPLTSRGECDFVQIVDSHLCLTENEYKFLPLWAGGMDDGTGGVFEEAIPVAERGGPIGPGPAYHTGSTMDSWAGSEVGPDDSLSVIGSSALETEVPISSVRAEDGHQSGVDHRDVMSEEDFLDEEVEDDNDDLSDEDNWEHIE